MGYVSGSNTVTAFNSADIGPDCGEYGDNLSQIADSPIANNDYLFGTAYYIRGSYGVGSGNDAPSNIGAAPSYNGDCSSGTPGTTTGTGTTTGDTTPSTDDVTNLDITDPTALGSAADNFTSGDTDTAAQTMQTLTQSTDPDAVTNAATVLDKMSETDDGVDAGSKILEKMGETDDGAESGAKILDKMAESTSDTDKDAAAKVVQKIDPESGGKVLSKMEPANTGSILKNAVDLSSTLSDTEKENAHKAIKELTESACAQAITEFLQKFSLASLALLQDVSLTVAASTDTTIEQYLNDPNMIAVINNTASGELSLKKYLSTISSGLHDGSVAKGYIQQILSTQASDVKQLNGSGVLEVVSAAGSSYPVTMLDIILETSAVTGDDIQDYQNGFGLTLKQDAGQGAVGIVVAPMCADINGLSAFLSSGTSTVDPDNGFFTYVDASGNEFVGSFGWDAGISSAAGGDNKQMGAYSITASDPASTGYYFEINYKDGSVQRILPAVKDFDTLYAALSAMKTQNSIEQFSFDKDTGIIDITISGSLYQYKPYYLVTPSTVSQAALDAADNGIIWQSVDFNKDGVSDLKMITAKGEQIILSVAGP